MRDSELRLREIEGDSRYLRAIGDHDFLQRSGHLVSSFLQKIELDFRAVSTVPVRGALRKICPK